MKSVKYIPCPVCKGKGHTIDGGERLFAGVVSFGLIPVLDYMFQGDESRSIFANECYKCKGEMVISVKK